MFYELVLNRNGLGTSEVYYTSVEQMGEEEIGEAIKFLRK